MKIVDAQRNGNDIAFILEDGTEVLASWEYILAHKPQIGDEYITEEPVTE